MFGICYQWKKKILPFIKKYYISVLLGLIALQLTNISCKLDQSGRYEGVHIAWKRWLAYYDDGNQKEYEREQKRAAEKIGDPPDIINAHYRRLY